MPLKTNLPSACELTGIHINALFSLLPALFSQTRGISDVQMAFVGQIACSV